jgi:hypothetical protein
MRGKLGTIAAILVATFAVATPAHGDEAQTRAGYVARVEPICQRNTEAGQRILSGASERIRKRELEPAGRQFIRASKSFGRGVRQIVAVPRPPADEARLQKWFGFLRIVKVRLFKLGRALTEDERLKATHDEIQLERSANAANNVSFAFEFHACRLTRARFR